MMDSVRATVLVAIVVAVQEMSERQARGGVFDVPAMASFIVDEIERDHIIAPRPAAIDPLPTTEDRS